MKPFAMQVEYLDPASGEMVAEDVLIDDVEVLPAEPFLPMPDDNDECP